MNDIEKAIIFYDGNGDMPYCDLVYESLKKRLPMKPRPEHRYYGFDRCPVCQVVLMNKSTFCGNCGQALDWSGDGE